MSEIKKGDLVWVHHPSPCCGSRKEVGRVFIVKDVLKSKRHLCPLCGAIYSSVVATLGIRRSDGVPIAYEIVRLRKINPPAQSQSRETVVPWEKCDWQPEKIIVSKI